MSSVLRSTKEATSLRRQFTVYPYFAGGTNQFFTASDGKLSRIAIDISGVDYVIARDMGTEMTINAIDSNIVNSLGLNLGNDDIGTTVNVVRKGTARKFQVLSMVSGLPRTGNMYAVDSSSDPTVRQNIVGNGESYSDTFNSNALFSVLGENLALNDALIVGSADTITTSTTQSLPFGTFWAINDPIVIQYEFSQGYLSRAIKNRIDETTLF